VGQKTNPKAFRLVTTENHLSNWYSTKESYASLLEEDFFIREETEKIFKEFLILSKIEISRLGESKENQVVNIKIHSLFPRSKDMYRKIVTYFSQIEDVNAQKALSLLNNKKAKLSAFAILLLRILSRDLISKAQQKTNNLYTVSFVFIKNTFEDASLIAKFIAEQLVKRIPFRRVVKKCLKKAQLTSAKGIKVELSGRLNGIEIARSDWKRQGKIPLHTLRAKIDYTHQEAHTIYGVIGIKVWLFIK
jgi:small subunit ribosomal protein S3